MKCTCHPSEAPWPCAHCYAYSECVATPIWKRIWRSVIGVPLRDFILTVIAAAVFALAWSASDTSYQIRKIQDRLENIEGAK